MIHMATYGLAVTRLHGGNNQKQDFDTMITVFGGINKYNDDIVAITSDSNGSLWLHNAGNGFA
jgi:hypothetical protein